MNEKTNDSMIVLKNEISILDMEIEEMLFYLKNMEVDNNIYNKVKAIYLSQDNSFDRVIVFAALIKTMKQV
ncbi:MAG: hypothetical protein ACK5LC_01440 [Coprobacillaceae bacterium]